MAVMNTAYIRFDVNIRCKGNNHNNLSSFLLNIIILGSLFLVEVLYIEDTRTGEVIQGTKEPVIYTHHVSSLHFLLRFSSDYISSNFR